MTVERRPFAGRCQAEVKSKGYRRWKEGKGTGYRCRNITTLVQNGQWRCGFHLVDGPVFAVKGQFVEVEEDAS